MIVNTLNKKIDAYELFNNSSYEDVAKIKDFIEAQNIVLKDDESDIFLCIYEIYYEKEPIEKLLMFSPCIINEKEIKSEIKNKLLIEYIEKYSHKDNSCITINESDMQDSFYNILNFYNYKFNEFILENKNNIFIKI